MGTKKYGFPKIVGTSSAKVPRDFNLLADTVDQTISSEIGRLDAITAALASGSPKGVYASLSALQTAKPTGDANVYIVSADGKWYFWNGTAWIAGGVYQSTGIAAKGVALSQLGDDVLNVIENIKTVKTIRTADIRVVEGVIADFNYNNNTFTWSNKTRGDYVVPYVDSAGYDEVTYTNLGAIFILLGVTSDATNTYFLLAYASSATELRLQRLTIKKADGIAPVGLQTIATLTNTSAITLASGDGVKVTNLNGVIDVTVTRANTLYPLVSGVNLSTVDATRAYNFIAGGFHHSATVYSYLKDMVLVQNRYNKLTKNISDLQTQVNALQAPPRALSRYTNKIGYFMGDSITAGSNSSSPYLPIVQAELGLSQAVNCGIGGSGMMYIANIHAVPGVTCDFALMFAGTNDFSLATPLGALGDVTGDTFYGVVYKTIERWLTNYPTTPIGFVTPLQRQYQSGTMPSVDTNSLGLKLKDYVTAIKEVCAVYGVPCLDLHSESGINKLNITSMLNADKVHLKPIAADKVGKKIASFINAKVI